MPEKLIHKHKRIVTSGPLWFCGREDTSVTVTLAKKRHLPRGWFVQIVGDMCESMAHEYAGYRDALKAFGLISDGVTKEQLVAYGFRQR